MWTSIRKFSTKLKYNKPGENRSEQNLLSRVHIKRQSLRDVWIKNLWFELNDMNYIVTRWLFFRG